MANAVLDGVDGILLGAETLRGKYPVDTVRTILDICRQAEKVFDHANHFERLVHVRAPPAPPLRACLQMCEVRVAPHPVGVAFSACLSPCASTLSELLLSADISETFF